MATTDSLTRDAGRATLELRHLTSVSGWRDACLDEGPAFRGEAEDPARPAASDAHTSRASARRRDHEAAGGRRSQQRAIARPHWRAAGREMSRSKLDSSSCARIDDREATVAGRRKAGAPRRPSSVGAATHDTRWTEPRRTRHECKPRRADRRIFARVLPVARPGRHRGRGVIDGLAPDDAAVLRSHDEKLRPAFAVPLVDR